MGFDFDRARPRFAVASRTTGDPIELLAPLKRQLEVGDIDGSTFVAAGIEVLGFRGKPEEFQRIWEDIFTPIEPMWELVGQVAASHRLFLLSNTSDIHKEFLFRDFQIFEKFAGGIYSYSSRCLKPDPVIFAKAIDELCLVPGETLYVDDLAENVRAAERAGFRSVRYDPASHDQFLHEARELGFLFKTA